MLCHAAVIYCAVYYPLHLTLDFSVEPIKHYAVILAAVLAGIGVECCTRDGHLDVIYFPIMVNPYRPALRIRPKRGVVSELLRCALKEIVAPFRVDPHLDKTGQTARAGRIERIAPDRVWIVDRHASELLCPGQDGIRHIKFL
jgi:hypothetical protein